MDLIIIAWDWIKALQASAILVEQGYFSYKNVYVP